MTESADEDQQAEIEFEGWPELTDAVLVAAFEGWNDAGDAATGSIEHLELVWDTQPLMAIDPDEYYDFQVNRPTVSMVDGVTRRVSWPTTRLSVCRPPGPASRTTCRSRPTRRPRSRYCTASRRCLTCPCRWPNSPSRPTSGRNWSTRWPPRTTRSPTTSATSSSATTRSTAARWGPRQVTRSRASSSGTCAGATAATASVP